MERSLFKLEDHLHYVQEATQEGRIKRIGHIIWDASPPQGQSYQTHKFSFYDAVEAATMLIWQKVSDTLPNVKACSFWIACSSDVLPVITTNPTFEPMRENLLAVRKLCYVGSFKSRPVFLDGKAKPHTFRVGDANFYAEGTVANSETMPTYQKI